MNYENSLKELENIVKQLESGKLTLDEGVELFEKGVSLTKACLTALDEYKGKITSIRGEVDKLLADNE